MKSQGLTPSVVTYNTLILACRGTHKASGDDGEEEKRLERAIGLLHDMKREGLTPDVITLHSLVRVAVQDDQDDYDTGALGRVRRRNDRRRRDEQDDDDYEDDSETRQQKKEAAARQVDRALAMIDRLAGDFPGLAPNANLYNGLIAICQHGAHADKAAALYRRMRASKVKPTVETFRSLLAGLNNDYESESEDDTYDAGQRRAEQAMGLLEEMKRDGPPPTSDIFGRVIDIVARQGEWDTARGLVREMEERGLLMSAKVYNVLLRECVRMGDVQRAQEVLKEMRRKDMPGDYKTSLLRKELERLRPLDY
jgi:pentatricopeptide repeat protein